MTAAGGLADHIAAAKLWLISPTPRPVGRPARIRLRPTAQDAHPGENDRPKDLPYLTSALYALITVPSTEVVTLTADEHWRIYVNPRWATTVSIPVLGAQLAHQLWHLLHAHAERARGMLVALSTAKSWARAADAALAATLTADQLLPVEHVLPGDLRLPDGKSTEEYFAALSRLPIPDPDGETGNDDSDTDLGPDGSAVDGIPRSYELPPDTDQAGAVTTIEADRIRRIVAVDYIGHCTARSIEPGDAWRWAKAILEPKIDWRPLLTGALRRAVAWTNGHTEYTYRRRSRRQGASPDVILPGTRRPVPNVAIIIDTSGSVDDILLSQALGEIDGAITSLGVSGACVTVLACDAAVHTVTRIRSARESRLVGGGGTDLRAGITAAALLSPKPDIIVVVTDGYTPWPDNPPPGATIIATLFARHGQAFPATPDWATRIECAL